MFFYFVILGDNINQEFQKIDHMNLKGASPGGPLYSPTNIKAVPTGPKNIQVNWNPSVNATGYRVGHYLMSAATCEFVFNSALYYLIFSILFFWEGIFVDRKKPYH